MICCYSALQWVYVCVSERERDKKRVNERESNRKMRERKRVNKREKESKWARKRAINDVIKIWNKIK